MHAADIKILLINSIPLLRPAFYIYFRFIWAAHESIKYLSRYGTSHDRKAIIM